MRTLKSNFAVAFFGLTLFSACNGSATEPKAVEGTETNQQVAGVTYTCPMHPEVVSNEPGKCPKCGMFLEEVKSGEELDSAAAAHGHEAGDQH
ncbi:heavy metal-binding domain-containing protein [Rufibacter sp. XAAS-G3-1]|uniref:heavy metal-binding domain-containing protein n=1 Tax=Rufibacter sp. XAAS-G3-1 TaxID=2729134 RepID=UPI001C62DC60|nr:heavy metal-binding domain-containing protein [Rufibacter sp. XAAS-G3-1]